MRVLLASAELAPLTEVGGLGEAVGVHTPIHRFIATVLKPHVNGRTQSSGEPVAAAR